MKKDNKKLTVIGVDLGGTKVAIGSVLVNDNSIVCYHNYPTEIESILGVGDDELIREKFSEKIANLVVKVIEETETKGYEVYHTIGFGSPGNIKNGIIRAKTTPQFGKAFDDFDIASALANKISIEGKKKFTVLAYNDALAQMAFGISELVQHPEYAKVISNQRVAYIGPGTGLGGGFARVTVTEESSNMRANLNFFTDGHIGDIIVGYAEDGTPLWAEFELLSGMYISKKTNGLTGKDLAADIDKHLLFIEELGDNLGRIIFKIYSGDVYKARETTMWSDEDRESVKGIYIFIIGGSIGVKGRMGEIMRTRAKHYLDNVLGGADSNPIQIIPILSDSAHAGLIGAANFVQF
ncbi:MAG: ROK family protein [Oligoflexia bacterium]|nr:ROK family protein [Oligoflexia bacterium]